MIIYKRLFAATFIIFCSQNSIAEIYKCKTAGGKIEFRDKRCDENSSTQEVLTKPNRVSCYRLTNSEGASFEVNNFWTYKQNDKALFYVEAEQEKKVFPVDKIQSVKIEKQENGCALGKLVNDKRESFNISICEDIAYTNDSGEAELKIYRLASIKNCQINIKTDADGFWQLDDKKYSIRSAYASYSKKSNELKVVVFPFLLTQKDEESLAKKQDVDLLLKNKYPDLSKAQPAFGIVFKLNDDLEDISKLQISDITQFQTLLIYNRSTRVRSYDNRWRNAIDIKKLQITHSEQEGVAAISWKLSDREQQAEIDISTMLLEED